MIFLETCNSLALQTCGKLPERNVLEGFLLCSDIAKGFKYIPGMCVELFSIFTIHQKTFQNICSKSVHSMRLQACKLLKRARKTRYLEVQQIPPYRLVREHFVSKLLMSDFFPF